MPIARFRRTLRRTTPLPRQQHRSDGFTLVEILVVVAVLGLLTLLLAQATRFSLVAWRAQTRDVDRYSDLLAVDGALRQLVARMKPGDPDQDNVAFAGRRDECRFITDLPMAADGLPTRAAAVALTVDRAHRLVLSWTPHPHAERLGPPMLPAQTVLLEHVAGIDLGYWDAAVAGGSRWLAEWNGRTLPRLVRLRIEFPRGDRRRWPDIVMATAAEPWQ